VRHIAAAKDARKMKWMIPLFLAPLLAPPAARANWEYTRWGMNPEQVVAASGGKAELLPGKPLQGMPLAPRATGTFTEGSLHLRTTFTFEVPGGGLQCVSYGVLDHADDNNFKAALIKRYGPAQTKSGLALVGQETLGWKTATDEIEATFSKDDPAFAMQCAK
jgi:hypothetical protein